MPAYIRIAYSSISGGEGFAFVGWIAENFDHQDEHGGRGGDENDTSDDDEEETADIGKWL